MVALTPVLYGIGTGLPLVVGAVIGVRWRPPAVLVASLLAFASGSLVTALAFELFEPAVRTAGPAPATAGFLGGTALYVGAKYALDGRGGTTGVALLVAVVLDGLAENVTLGVLLAGNATGGPLAVLVGIAANNLPEAVGGATEMTESGYSAARTLGVWVTTATGLAATVVVGHTVFAGAGETVLALVQATGGGTVLASLAVEIMPDAYEDGGPGIAFATAAGFVATFLLA